MSTKFRTQWHLFTPLDKSFYCDPDPMHDIMALEEEREAIFDQQHSHLCTADSY